MEKKYLSKLLCLASLLSGISMGVHAQTTFNYTGGVQTYLVPSGVTSISVDVQGAKGGSGWTGVYGIGGAGGRVQCSMAVTPGTTLYIYAGGAGDSATGAFSALAGGWNGGGASGGIDYPGSGGGASDIRIGGTGLANRVVIGGGGGGAGYNCSGGQNGGAGGGLVGGSGFYCSSSTTLCYCPTGGTQTAGGTNGTCGGGAGSLGSGAAASATSYAGGGGGGYYGGGAGYYYGGGAGGSSYTDPVLCASVTNTQGYNTASNGFVIINTSLPSIGGYTSLCLGSTTTLTDAVSGGTWSSAVPAVATVGSATGVVTAVTAGSTTISYTIGSMHVTTVFTVYPLPSVFAITGGGSYCFGGSGVNIGLAGSQTGVSYQLYSGGAPVGSSVAGTGSAISFGPYTVAGTYTVVASNSLTGCASNMSGSVVVTVTPLPNVYTVSGGGSYCAGGAGFHVFLSGSDLGINYQLYNGSVAVSSSIPGTGSSLDFGAQTAAGTYNIVATDASTGCNNNMSGSAVIVVNPLPATISSGGSVCIGATLTVSDATSGGSWSSSNSAVATIATIGGSAGVATGVSVGTSELVYTLSTGCYMVDTLIVYGLPTISASSTASTCGDLYTLTASGGVSYSWSPSTGLSCPACGTTTISPAATTTYTVAGTDANGCVSSNTVTINGNRIFGHITFSSSTPDTLDMKVWLIQFNPTDSSITALDSTTTCTVDSMGYYEFDGEAAGNYMVKAMLLYGNPAGLSGYVPTYSLSSPYWYAAATAAHTSGSDSLHINMVYGTVPSGPGFIGGYVYAGAGKGTSGDAPVAGMLIYLENASTHVLTHTYTDATGAYSFGNLAYGNYIIYPEDYQYNTTSSSVITVSSSAPLINGINFKQYTTSMRILPFSTTNVKTVVSNTAVTVYPNPASNMLNVQWNNQSTGDGNMIITDMTGREVLTAALSIHTTNGQTQINLTGLNDGVYLINIKAGSINYSGKLLIQQ